MKIQAAALAGVAVVVAGCAPPHARRWADRAPLTPLSRLECPGSEGALKLVSAANDGRSCVYASSSNQTQVELKLVNVPDTPQTALDPIEADIKTLMPATSSPPPAPASSGAPSQDLKGRDVDIQLPGLSIRAGEDRANIRVGGMHIKANGQGNSVRVTGRHPGGGRLSIDASDSGAIIRTRSSGPNVRSTFMIASDDAGPAGWRAVGYEARGPRSGPLVVAVVKTKSEDREDVFSEVHSLVREIAGG